MKNLWFYRFIGLFTFMLFTLFFVQCEKETIDNGRIDTQSVLEYRNSPNKTIDRCACIQANFPNESLSDTEVGALVWMIEEEKLAGDLYNNLYSVHKANIFENIAQAENRHQEAINCLLEKYDLGDRITVLESGKFVNEDLQSIYDELFVKGKESLAAALTVGATVEDLDISDLRSFLENEEIDNQDIVTVFGELMRGSRNHLRAFVRNFDLSDTAYKAQYISEKYFDEIIAGEQERGGQICAGLNICDGSNNQNGKQANCANQNDKGNCSSTCQQGNQGNGNNGQGKNNGNQSGNNQNGNKGKR